MAKRVRVTAKEYADKHRRRTSAAIEDMRSGIAKVTEAPGAKAAQQQEKMRAKLVESIDSGKWARRVASVSLEDWKADMLDKGVGRVVSGLERAAPKVEAFAEQLIDHQNTLLVTLDGMPSVTLEDSIARATAWIRGMAKFERK